MSFDWSILHWIQHTLVCPALDLLMPKITLLGDNGAVVLGMGIGLAICAVGNKLWTALAKKGAFQNAR